MVSPRAPYGPHHAPYCPPSCMAFETLAREHGLRDGPRRRHFARSMAPSRATLLAVCIWLGTRRADMVCAIAMGSLRSRAVRPQRASDSLQYEFSWKFYVPTWNLPSPMQRFSAPVAACQVRFAERRAFSEKAHFPLTPSMGGETHPSICSSGLTILSFFYGSWRVRARRAQGLASQLLVGFYMGVRGAGGVGARARAAL